MAAKMTNAPHQSSAEEGELDKLFDNVFKDNTAILTDLPEMAELKRVLTARDRTKAQELLARVKAEVIGENDIVEFGDPLKHPSTASQQAFGRDKLREAQRTLLDNLAKELE